MVIEMGNWLFHFQEDYSQFFQDCNWYTFRFADIYFENEAKMGAYEANFVVLGLGLRIRWNHTDTEFKRELEKLAEEIGDDLREKRD